MSQSAPPRDLPGLRAVAARALADALPAGWEVRELRRLAPLTVQLDLGPAQGPVVSLEWHDLSDGREVPAFLRGAGHAVSYRHGPSAWDLDAAATPEAVKRTAARACEVLAEPPEPISLAAPTGAREAARAAGPIPMTAGDFGRWLAPRLEIGQVLHDGWALEDIHRFGPEELALVFGREGLGERPRLKVRLRDDARPAAHRTPHLDLLYRVPFGREDEADQARLLDALARALAAALDALDLSDSPGFVPVSRGPTEPVPSGPPPAFNLALPAPCHQQCAFCSVFEEVQPVLDVNSAYVQALVADLRRAGAAGTPVLRVNGLEPLNAPYLFELLDTAREAGFEAFHILSTFRPLADRAFAERFVAAMTPRFRAYVPLYGATAAVHDPLVATPGAFDELMRGLRNLRALAGDRCEVVFTTILMRGNEHDVPAMGDLVRQLGRWWELHLPFPNTSSARDRYHEIALTQTEVLRAVYPPGWWPLGDLPLGEILPCVALRHQRATGHALVTAERLRRRQREPSGTFYETVGFSHSLGQGQAIAFTSATVPCPHRDRCALGALCPAKVYQAYAQRFGLDELRPVSREQLRALADGDEILRMAAASAPREEPAP